jgi:Flp pilus assembly protein TadG
MMRAFRRDERGITSVEIAVLAPILFGAVLASFDAGLYVWRWSQAVQAARMGARLAAVSNPVSSDLGTMTGTETGAQVGEAAGAYERVCTPSNASCSNGAYSAAAWNRIYYGPNSATCGQAPSRDSAGMCDVLPLLRPQNITITYRNSGVDVVGVAGSLRPMITVQIAGAGPRLVLFDKILPATLPVVEVTMLAEDLRSTA